ncbi:MAG: hypothetical protein DRQ54_07350 [Gammaproteobacteria bacterium]|nr:MAG: hypothetical protein DRQ54_07350 [Gammaproteobacteria bacterium]RLA11610.1 MAG: hypothetical protein DRQ52_09310 [Gammaproteobacteria bacterium]
MAKQQKSHAPVNKRTAGFTLIEVMTAVVIGSILMVAAVTIMVNSKDTYEVQDDLGRLQENARFAMHLLAKDIRMAGYFGCSAKSGDIYDHIEDGGSGNLFNSSAGLEGMDNYDAAATWEPSGKIANVDGLAGITFLPDSDGLTVRYLDPSTAIDVVAKMPQASADIEVTNTAGLVDGQIIAITDCASADIVQITSLPGGLKIQHNSGGGTTPGNVNSGLEWNFPGCGAANCLSKQYGDDAKVMSLKAVRYFLQDKDADGSPSLYRVVITPSGGNAVFAAQKLVAGVDSLQLTYGEDTTGDGRADTYRPASGVGSWSNVSTVKIGMLFQTVDEYGQQTDTIAHTVALGNSVNGEDFAAQNDHRRRRLFTSTVLLRNPQ